MKFDLIYCDDCKTNAVCENPDVEFTVERVGKSDRARYAHSAVCAGGCTDATCPGGHTISELSEMGWNGLVADGVIDEEGNLLP